MNAYDHSPLHKRAMIMTGPAGCGTTKIIARRVARRDEFDRVAAVTRSRTVVTPAASCNRVADLHLIWPADGPLGSTKLPQPARTLPQCRRHTHANEGSVLTSVQTSVPPPMWKGLRCASVGSSRKREMRQRRR